MKKLILLALCFTALTVLNSSAKIWRVNSAGLPADFTTIQAAHDATTVLAGDTLHIEPSVGFLWRFGFHQKTYNYWTWLFFE